MINIIEEPKQKENKSKFSFKIFFLFIFILVFSVFVGNIFFYIQSLNTETITPFQISKLLIISHAITSVVALSLFIIFQPKRS
jgi:heme/copper-type cytochrome/quinol oxidase subunit 2